jgi:hypothetical protein
MTLQRAQGRVNTNNNRGARGGERPYMVKLEA